MNFKCEFLGTIVQSMDWLLLVPAIITSEMTPNDFKMTLQFLITKLMSFLRVFIVLNFL
jgi:hypothetical protein